MHLTKSPTRSSSSSSSNSSSSSGIAYKFECHSNSKQNSKTGKMAAEARTISKPGHIRDRRVRSLPHILLLAIAVVSLHFESVSAQSMMTKNEPMFISRSETFKFITGETIVLPCEVANTDTYVVAWKRGIAILTAGSVKVTPDPRVRLVNGFNLQIRDALPTDAGDYICQIATMDPREITHTVEILVPPRIHHISTGGHLQVKKGSSVRIECSATGNPMPNVTWSRKNNILPNGEEKLHSHVLSIENVDRHKGGVYICTANNRVGQPASSQVVLHVLFSPEISVERSVVFSGEGHEATLVCIVHGETQPEVIWFKDTMQLDTTERHIMETRGSRHTLIIRKVHPQDFGNYSCVAENQLGKARKTLQLSGKPNVAVFNSPPISQYKDRYNISWAVDSHSPIEEYKLSYRKLPQGHEVVGNAIDSPSSSSSMSSSSSQMYGSGLHAHRIGSNMGGLSGLSGSGSYSGYGNVIHWGHNDWRNVVLPAVPVSHHYAQGMSYMVRGLDSDQHYEATVQSRNRYGWSDLTNSFVFSTSSNDGPVDLSTFLNHGLSDNEMRDLSVTFYGSSAINRQKLGLLALSSATLALSLLVA
ncbi:leucine-rich repeats and immunoglobulin-like domains protein 1 isoform X1 [Drosophila sechellia]|nr:leucine-rich repeats and immunoglobulin-like domains protein 1 isoform X1 [Drosophila sechellia]